MLEESLKRNIIVAMDTGSGKTAIAILRVQAEVERCLPTQLTWFLAPTVALCHQQYEVFRTHLPQYQARFLSGEDNVDRWSNQAIWDAVLLNMQIIVSTHKVLEDALTHGFVQIAKLALLVYDEAHHCTGRHPANKILQDFYHPRLANGDTVPHILGLTASPVVNAKAGGLETIEGNMNAVTRTPKMHRSEMLQYVHQPLVVKIPYTASSSISCEMEQSSRLHALQHAYAGLDIMRDPYVVDLLGSQEPDAVNKLDKVLLSRKTYCQVQMKTLLAKAEEIYKELGAWSVEWYIKTCISNFMDTVQKDDCISSELTLQEKQYLCSIFDRMNAMTAGSQPLPGGILPSVSPKAHALIEILVNEAAPAFTGLVFVQQRVTVAALQQLLARHPETAKLKVSTFIGTSSYASRKSSFAEYVEPRNQQGVLDDFRSGQRNLIIATSVLEEGIDVSACNVVICFEEPKNLKAFIQRRGRARKEQSKYFVLVEDDDRSTAADKWQSLELRMKKIYMDEMRQLQAVQQEESDSDDGQRTFRIERTGALLTLDNAVPHLYHFCATLSASPYVDLRPEFSVSENLLTKLFSAVVILPTAVDPLLRRCRSSRPWTTERQAKKDAAYEACIALHKAGLINDRLLPLVSRKEEELPEDEVVEERPAVIAVSERSNPWVTAALKFTGTWLESIVTLETEGRTVASMKMLLPIQLPNVPTFVLYWNEDISYQVTVKASAQSRTLCLSDDELTKPREVTHLLLKSVFGVRVAEGRFDFPALILPTEYSVDLESWLHEMRRKREAGSCMGNGFPKEDIGLVRVRGREAAAYMFEGFELLYSSSDYAGTTPEVQLRVKKLPRRRDFLHPTTSAYASLRAAHTATELFPADDCMIDILPTKYSLFSLFLPSILHRIECFMLAEELRATILAPVGIQDLSLVLEAISTSSARESSDYQRLEFLGDCILGLCTAVHLMATHPSWPEGFLTRSKGNSNSNSYLARAALRVGLDRFIINTAFAGAKWKPTYISELLQALPDEKREMSTKTLADVVEACIGASFVDGGMRKVDKCLHVLLPDLFWSPLEEGQALLFHGVPATTFHTVHMENLQRLIGYTFKKPVLLQEAVTHASYNADATSLSYQRLEFLGDAVLDYLVVQRLFRREPAYKEHQMHTMRTALVNADFLAFLCMEWNIEQERAQVVEDKDTGTFSTVEVAVKQSLWQFMRHNNAQIAKAQQAAILRHNELKDEITKMLERGDHYPWALLARTEADKFFSDIVESVLGAVCIDSHADTQACENVLERLGLLKYARRIMGEGEVIHLLHPKEELGRLAEREKVEYETRSNKEGWTCVVKLGSEEIVEVDNGTSRIEAETRAATLAVELMRRGIGRTSSKQKAEEDMERGRENNGSSVEDGVEEATETQ